MSFTPFHGGYVYSSNTRPNTFQTSYQGVAISYSAPYQPSYSAAPSYQYSYGGNYQSTPYQPTYTSSPPPTYQSSYSYSTLYQPPYTSSSSTATTPTYQPTTTSRFPATPQPSSNDNSDFKYIIDSTGERHTASSIESGVAQRYTRAERLAVPVEWRVAERYV